MKYFTPKLYLEFNQNPSIDVDAAEGEWESNLIEYWNRLGIIKDQFPKDAQWLASRSFHDAKILNLNIGDAKTSFRIKPYCTTDEISWTYYGHTAVETIENWPFSKANPDWLYDEWDVTSEGFEHRIFLSDGKVLTIKFQDLKLS